ncbi:zinc finger protein RFP-like isoform X2 [Chelonoidis abingdonii]|uniref:zinc finger protein RFP-like isoform X2 n=1 Tax=Chelonoidis abingdonii TaxID=106734 RepID=UPI0013F284D1|nr:zinc finger protein RFP-like isoform X1 [Chelonoidis abingdonii]
MASENPMASLQYEATCPICLGDFKDPVIIDCGHNFCRACIAQCWEGSSTAATCPQCRETVQQRNLRPNRQLANVLKIVKQLNLQVMKDAGGERVCVEHQEPLKLFCEEDQTPICLVCDRSRTHKAHTVVPIEEAAQEYKEKIQAHLKILRKEREKLLGFKVTGEEKFQEYLIQTQTERQKIVSEFQQLRQFLEEQERLLLAQLEKLDKEIGKIQNENITKFSEQISRLSELISELEGKCQKPASEFLQDFKSTLSRCEKGKFQQPVEISPELEKRLNDFAQKNIDVMETLRKFKDVLPSEVETRRGKSLGSYRPVNVTLDPGTAHPQLILSEDRKSVRWEETRQDLPNHPERFDTEICVLGCEGFTSGRHCWGVEVGNRGSWAVGVARESVKRKGGISPNPEQGIWAVERCWDQFHALTSPRTPLPVSWDPRKIRVCLDCERGQVTFFDAGDESPLFTLPLALVPGERIQPWFWVGGSQLRLSP